MTQRYETSKVVAGDRLNGLWAIFVFVGAILLNGTAGAHSLNATLSALIPQNGGDSSSQSVGVDSLRQSRTQDDNNDTRRVIVEYNVPSALQRVDRPITGDMKNKTRVRIRSARARVGEVHQRLKRDLQDLHRSVNKPKDSSTPDPSIHHTYDLLYAGAAVELPEDLMGEVTGWSYVKKVYVDRQVRIMSDSIRKRIGAVTLSEDRNVTGEGVDVAILDTGVDYMHEALGGGIGDSYKVKGGYDQIHLDRDPMDDNGHGTKVASVIAADGDHSGIAPKVNLYAYKVLGEDGTGLASDVIRGLERAVNKDVDVINMSLGGPGGSEAPLSKATDNAVKAGVLVVTSAGNQGDEYWSLKTPGAAALALTVGSSTMSGRIAGFSSRGPTPKSYDIKPDIVAPGVDAITAERGGGYGTSRGTSISSPVVAGAASLLYEKYSGRSPKHIKSMLMQSARDLKADIWSQGHGEIRVDKAYERNVTSSPSHISLGLLPSNSGTWSEKDTVLFYNLGESSISYNLNIDGERNGLELDVNKESFSLEPGDSVEVVFSATFDNEILGFPDDSPLDFSGQLSAASEKDTMRIPWRVIKIPHMTISTPYNGSVRLHAHKKDKSGDTKNVKYYSGNDSEHVTWRFFDNTPYNIIAEFIESRNYRYTMVIREGIDITQVDTLEINPEEATHRININPRDADGNALENEDALISLKRLKHETGYGFSRNITADVIKISPMKEDYKLEGVSYYRTYPTHSSGLDPMGSNIHDYITAYFSFSGIRSDKVVQNESNDYSEVTYKIPSFPDASKIGFSTTSEFNPRLLVPAQNYLRVQDLPKAYRLHFLSNELAPKYWGFDFSSNRLIFESARHFKGKGDTIRFKRGGYYYHWHADNLPPIAMNHVLPFFTADINNERIRTGKDKGFFHNAFGGVAGKPGEPVLDVFVKLHRDHSVIYEKEIPDGQFENTSVDLPSPQKNDWLEVTLEKDNYFVEDRASNISARYYYGGSNSGTGPKISELRLTSNGKYSNVLSFQAENTIELEANRSHNVIERKMASYNQIDSMHIYYRATGDSSRWKLLSKRRSANKMNADISDLRTGFYDMKFNIYDQQENTLAYSVKPAFKFISAKRKVVLESSEQPGNARFNLSLSSPDTLGYENITHFEFNLSYNDTLLEYITMSLASGLEGHSDFQVEKVSPGKLKIRVESSVPIQTQGDLVHFTFRTRESSGESALSVENFTYSEEKLEVEGTEGRIRVHPILLGDVSNNQQITAYDASKVLQYTHDVDSLDDTEKLAANVGGSEWITSQDAILILRYVIGQLRSFPVQRSKEVTMPAGYSELTSENQKESHIQLGDVKVNQVNNTATGSDSTKLAVEVPLYIENVEQVTSMETQLNFSSGDIHFDNIDFNFQNGWLGRFRYNNKDKKLHIAAAGPAALEDRTIAELSFTLVKKSGSSFDVQVEGISRVNEKAVGNIQKTSLLDIPKQITLQQNYPNPFNPSTTISYGVPAKSHVKLNVYNIRGQKISTLVNTVKEPGMHTLQFNGAHLASGVYIYALQTPAGVKTKKFTIVK